MSRRLICIILGLCAALLIGNPRDARAVTVASNLGPGSSFSGPARTFGNDFSGVFDSAVSFTTGSSAYIFDSADIALAKDSGPNTATFRLFNDVLGSPGVAQISATTGPLPSFPAPAVTNLSFGSTFVLQPTTTYWLVADGVAATSSLWHENNQGQLGFKFTQNNGPWTVDPTATLAFRINGTPQTVNAVPLPAAAWAGFALIGGIGAKRAAAARAGCKGKDEPGLAA